MRPPSYYTSLANSNSSSSNRYTGNTSSSSSPSSYYSSSLPTSHQQLRSSFSSSSSASYVTRSHLPYVPQSMLVAHCITGGGSTTKPYGHGSSSSTRPSSYLSSSNSSGGRSYYPSTSSYLSSRPNSAKRNPYLTSSNYSPSSSYLSPASSAALSHSQYHPTSSSGSSYNYKPIRLRERPLLTQILRQIKNPSPIISATGDSYKQSTRVHSESSNKLEQKADKKENNEALTKTTKEDNKAREENWSSDVARNISRNKYLIKFREFDKRNSISPIQLLADDDGVESDYVNKSDLEVSENLKILLAKEPIKTEAEEKKMKLPLGEIVKSDELPEKQLHQLTADPIKLIIKTKPVEEDICDKQREVKESTLKPKVASKEKRNIKLKLKTFNANSNSEQIKPAATTKRDIVMTKESNNVSTNSDQFVDEPIMKKENDKLLRPSSPKTQSLPGEDAAPPPGAKTKVKKLIKKSSSKATIEAKTSSDNVAQQNNDMDAKSSPSSGSVTKKTLANTKVSKQKELGEDTKKVKKSEPKSQIVADERKVLSLKQPSDNKEVIGNSGAADDKEEEEEGEKVTKKKKKQTKIISSSQKVAKRNSNLASETTTSKSANPSGESSPISSETTNSNTTNNNNNKRIRFREYNYDDFNFLSVLGHGGWGFVILAELKDHDACFAVKCIKKITIVEDDDFDSIMIERKVLTLGNVHPFICKLFCTFETEGYLFFVMEYCAGGDLMFHVQKEGKFSESRCRFYAAEIICAIRFLHNRHIIYRDLKLDNILLDSRGHVRLVDFGMCQCRSYREEMLPSNFCGTPEYISPEIIKGVPYNHSVDWWSFGVLLYEMAVGKMPFRGNDENELLWNVCYEQIHYPMFLTKELTSLLQLLLEREPTKRMGMATCKAGDICDQAWFRGVDWQAIEGLRVPPPFVPEVNCKRDVQNFDADFTQSTPELSPVDASTLERIDQNQFQKFPYTNPNIFIFD